MLTKLNHDIRMILGQSKDTVHAIGARASPELPKVCPTELLGSRLYNTRDDGLHNYKGKGEWALVNTLITN